MSTITIYHNPRCSKSRATLELVERHGDNFKVIEYLETPPTAKELESLLAKLGIEPEQLRTAKARTFTSASTRARTSRAHSGSRRWCVIRF